MHLIPETSFVSPLVPQDDIYYTTFDWMVDKYASDSIAKVWVHTRTTVADVDGRFTFTNVPAGRYIVETKLFWQYVSCGFFGCSTSDTGAVLRKRIEVTQGQQVEAQLTSVITR